MGVFTQRAVFCADDAAMIANRESFSFRLRPSQSI